MTTDLIHIVIPVSIDMDASTILDIVQDLCPELEEALQSYGSYNDEDVASINELDVSIDTAPALAAAAPELLAACQDLWNAIVKDAFLLTSKQCEKIREDGTTQAAIDRAIAAIAAAQR